MCRVAEYVQIAINLHLIHESDTEIILAQEITSHW